MKLKRFADLNEAYFGEDEGIIENYLLVLFGDYLVLSKQDENIFDTWGYSTIVSKDDFPGDDYDWENDETKYKYYTVKKNEIEIFKLKLDYAEGTLELDEIIHRNHYMDLVEANWKIATKFLYEKMKNDNL